MLMDTQPRITTMHFYYLYLGMTNSKPCSLTDVELCFAITSFNYLF